jgi:hypothetical protein
MNKVIVLTVDISDYNYRLFDPYNVGLLLEQLKDFLQELHQFGFVYVTFSQKMLSKSINVGHSFAGLNKKNG